MISRLVAGVAALVLIAGLSACASESYPKDVVEGYFSAIGSRTPEGVLKGKEFAAPGSNAEAYVIEQSASHQAMMDGGDMDKTKYEVLLKPDEVYLCAEGYDKTSPKTDDLCSVYTKLEFKDGKLVNFFAGGTSLEGRIVLGSGSATSIGNIGTANYIAAYETISGDLVVVMEITSKTSVLDLPYDATYISSNGRPVEVSSTDGPSELKSGRTGNVSYFFAGAKIGGKLELNFHDADYNKVLVSIPTK